MSKELVLGVVIGASLKAGFATAFGRAEKSAQALGNEIKSATKHHEQFGRSIRARLALNPTQNLAKEARAFSILPWGGGDPRRFTACGRPRAGVCGLMCRTGP